MLTAEQLTERRNYIGASEAAAICEVDIYRTPYDIWCAKTGRVDNFSGNDATAAGDRLEPIVLDWAAKKLGAASIERSVFVRHPHVDFIAANLDAVFNLGATRVNVDAKTSGIVSPLRHENWTDEEFPEPFTVQLMHQMACDPTLDHAYLAALCPPKGFLIYRVERDQALIDVIMERLIDFWERHVVTDRPPEESLPSMDVAKRLRRVPKSETTIDRSLVEVWQELKAVAKEAAEAEEAAKLTVIAALGDAEQGRYDGGSVTYFESQRDGYEVKPAKFRTLRVKK